MENSNEIIKKENNHIRWKVAGIDPSLRSSGIAILDSDGNLGLHLVKSEPLGEYPKDDLERIRCITQDIATIIEGCDIAVIESPSFNSRNTRSLVQLSALNYFIRASMSEMGIRWYVVMPTTLKKFVTGKGNCEKSLIMMSVLKRWGVEIDNDNKADAFGMAKMGEAIISNPTWLTEDQKESVRKIKISNYE